MKELNPTWKIALQVIWRHNRISNRITSSLFLGIAVITGLVNWFFDLGINFDTLKTYKFPLLAIILFIHFVPVNIYAVKSILNRNFGKFRLSLAPHDEI